MKLRIFLPILFAVIGTTHAQDSVALAMKRLVNINEFALGGIGYAGTTSQGEKDYQLILVSSSALAKLETLYATGNLQAKCYALVGIRKLDRNRFNRLVASLPSPGAQVRTASGCIIRSEQFGTVVKRITAGDYHEIRLR